MALKISTGVRNYVLDTGCIKDGFAAGFINIYSGTAATTADDAIPGGATLLCTISIDKTGVGINFDAAASGGVLSKAPAEIWSGYVLASGTATWYRFVAPGDDGTLSSSQLRMQGTVAVAGADLNLSSVALTIGAVQTIDFYSIAQPTL